MAEEENPGGRWTCEACGCNTNQSSDRACSICGTSHSAGHSILRRHGAAYAARAGWIARGLRRQQEDLDLDEDELWESVVDNMEMAAGDDMEALAMEVGGARRYNNNNSNNRSFVQNASGRRLLEAARAFTAQRETVDPAVVLRAATLNAGCYRPVWVRPSQLTVRGRNSVDLQVGEGERQNLAHVPLGAGEGRAIRADQPLPRETGRRAFGFRVAFDHPTVETGGNMGGCHLIGVTTSSFTAYSEPNGLQQSPFFWGIEDGGQKYEGSQFNSGRRRAYSSFRNEFVTQEAPLNAANVLFGCRETVTVVCDYESRTLTFWRDGVLLGTLVTNLPRSGNLFPVAVPFNCGVTVAITGITDDPSPLLRAFASDCMRSQQGREQQLRQQLGAKRARLIKKGVPSLELKNVLRSIFLMYATNRASRAEMRIDYTMACRLWYRCGMKISCLDNLLQDRNAPFGDVDFHDFFSVVCRVVAADTQVREANLGVSSISACEIGDKVELVEGYEKYGDSSGGPLQPGDRGTVVELQRGPNGERRSIRVLYNGRRWWYQPQAVISERSGLIDSPAVWFISGLLRAHGYDSDTLESIQNKQVTAASWRIGDEVIPKKNPPKESASALWVGRIVPETSSTRTSVAPHSRDSNTVLVEFIGRTFADAVGIKTPASADDHTNIQIRRVRTSKLLHAAILHHFGHEGTVSENLAESTDEGSKPPVKLSSSLSAPVGEKLQSEIAGVSRLEQSAIDAVAKECKKSSDALATLFSAGLPEAVVSAVDVAAKQLNSLEPREDLFEKIASIGVLLTTIAEKLYSEDSDDGDSDGRETEDMDNESMSSEQGVQPSLLAPGILAAAARRTGRAPSASLLRENLNDFGSNFQNLVNAPLDERRGMLLTLLSRGGRRRSGTSINEINERRNALETGFGHGAPSMALHGAPPFVFGAQFSNDVDQDTAWEGSSLPGTDVAATERNSNESVVLDSILRCRGDISDALSGSLRQGGPSFFSFIRHLISCGILVNSREWVEALLDSFQSKKNQLTSLHKISNSVLRHAVDEDGTPLLQLAIILGCGPDVIRHLISHGSPVGTEELRKAAITNQPRALAVLLQHTSYCVGLVAVENCTEEVRQVLKDAKARQDELDRQMRDAAGAFIASVVKKLISLGLATRRNPSSRTAVCSKVVSSILVGDVLLKALQHAQKSENSAGQDDSHGTTDRSGRVPVEENLSSLSSEGVLRYLPVSVMGETLFSDIESATTFFLLLEDYLCSKDMSDAAAGLMLYSIFLTHFPQLRQSSLLERFGLAELVSFHDVLASNRIAEILSQQFTAGLDVSSGTKGESPPLEPVTTRRQDGAGVVMCPKKHIAVLHITRHSSFRCDICGNGVDRGRPMHGCRECDWDACEECTDKSESGLIKCTAIRELACECLRHMTEDVSDAEIEEKMSDFPHGDVLEEMANDDTTMALNAIAVRLLQHDVGAVRDLGLFLQEPGRVSFHQFFSIVLPALHASLSGRSTDSENVLLTTRSGHKNKKARCTDALSMSPDARFEYSRAAVTCLLAEPNAVAVTDGTKKDGGAGEEQDEAVTNEKPAALGSNSSDPNVKVEITYSTLASELVRRIHQVLSLYEGVSILSSSVRTLDGSSGDKGGDLHSLTKLIELHLTQYTRADRRLSMRNRRLSLEVEPLVPISDIELHILRSCRVDDPSYSAYCQSLPLEAAVIVEKSPLKTAGTWQIARVIGYNEKTGAHCVQYASLLPHLSRDNVIDVSELFFEDDRSIVFDGPVANLILAAREYVIVHRRIDLKPKKPTEPDMSFGPFISENFSPSCDIARAIGTRIESNCVNTSQWKVYTLIGVENDSSSKSNTARAILVSDEGVVYSGVPPDQIQRQRQSAEDSEREDDPIRQLRQHSEDRSAIRRTFPFTFASRQRSEDDATVSVRACTLRRTWSAISLAKSLKPVDMNISSSNTIPTHSEAPACPLWVCQIGLAEVKLTCKSAAVEMPPKLSVKFSANDKLPSVCFSESSETTIAHALMSLHRSQEKWREWPPRSPCSVFFSLEVDTQSSRMVPHTKILHSGIHLTSNDMQFYDFSAESVTNNASLWSPERQDRSRKLSAGSLSPDVEEKTFLCDGLDEISVQCMDVIGILSQHAEDSSEVTEPDRPRIPGFANPSLSKKLMDQLDDPLSVVAGALPEWCTTAPAFAPRAFSYVSRQTLLQRAAFGVSRSTLKQQESKVNVGKLRHRMASLRARAVELMGEAFSGGAEDPTALQLQADELYGMEEALAARVRAAFRAAKWQEHSLQVAKAAVRREMLLADAGAVMERFASDVTVNRRRLEVRFDGETGFDAASGDEAGVTRGFYADVAEALLTSESVAGILPSSNCGRIAAADSSSQLDTMEVEDVDDDSYKLPLWIPDMDTSGQVVIPTPRADCRSSLGVFPRPLPTYHPQLPDVLRAFRFMGRLFAAAMRDGFMFPLPLSASFLKLVQHGPEKCPSPGDSKPLSPHDLVLTAADLPRPGFLGGEVYAAAVHICKPLDDLDAMDPPLSRVELQRRYQDIATDKNFARIALGMSYDYSFEDYFQDRTFVDPLDPTQGDEAVPLCPRGHKKAVTIYNVREWVALAKNFILHDGVIAQAVAFRQGIEDFFPAKFIRIFTAEELQRDVFGTGDNVDTWDESAVRKLFKLNGGKGAAEALVAVAAIGGEGGAALSRRFGPSSPTIAFLVKALLEATPRQRRQFLSFVTSVPIVTPGRIEVVPIVSPSGEFLPMKDPTCLPRANTCARRLYLPKFETFETFSQVFWAVVQEESRFKGFYEWRGNS